LKPKVKFQGTIKAFESEKGFWVALLPDGQIASGPRKSVEKDIKKWAKENNPTGFGICLVEWEKM